MRKLVSGLGGAIGSRYLKMKNRLVFTEYSGYISKMDLGILPPPVVVSQGSTVIKASYSFNCDTGTATGAAAGNDIFWTLQTAAIRNLTPINGAKIINLGATDFAGVTPVTMTQYAYGTTPINGNNDGTNKLVAGTVFCVLTGTGNYCKCKVTTYDTDLKIDWITYKVSPPAYVRLGSGYNQPEDIAVLDNETTAYVTERAGNIIKADLNNANRSAATVVCTGLTAPQQLWIDERHNQAYTVEYAASGRLVRVDLNTRMVVPIYGGLNNATGLVLSSDLSYAYIFEQGSSSIICIDLTTHVKTTVATGIANGVFISWADENETALMVARRDPDNKITLVDLSFTPCNVTDFITGTAARPSSVVRTSAGLYCVCCDGEVDQYQQVNTNDVFMGIGNVPRNLITAQGFADTTTQAGYPWQFPKNSPFGGILPVMIDHRLATDHGIHFYRILVNNVVRLDTFTNMVADATTGHFMPLQVKPDAGGLYEIQAPGRVYYHAQLGCMLDTTSLTNGMHTVTIEYFNGARSPLPSSQFQSCNLYIDNNSCVATLSMPTIGGVSVDNECGYLKYTNTTDTVTINYTAAKATSNFNCLVRVTRGAANQVLPLQGVAPGAGNTSVNGVWSSAVQAMFGATCAVKGIAVFTIAMNVTSTVIDGVTRQSQYDAVKSYTFCLAK